MEQRIPRALMVAVLGLLIGPAAWLVGAQAAKVEPKEVALDNGLKLLLVERHEQPVVAAGVFYDVGSVNDPAGKSGIAHMFEHMMFKGSRVIGTTDFDAEAELMREQDVIREKMNQEMNRMRVMKRLGQITDVLDPGQWTEEYRNLKAKYDELIAAQRKMVKNNEFANIYTANGGAMLNAGTSNDFTMYFVQLPANKLELFFWMESDRMGDAVMREFYIERDNVREERRLSTESTPTGQYEEAFEALFWQSHPYGIPVLGWASEVESITRDDVRDFFKVHYAPNNACVVIVGDFDTGEVIEMANRYFGRIPRGKELPPPVITEEPNHKAERRMIAEAETNPSVRIRFLTVAMGHSDEAALDVLSELLSGKSGRLFKRLVTEEDAAIGQPSGGNGARKYAGYFEINATVKEGHTPEEVEKLILDELDKLREGEISEKELEKVKNQVLASSVQRLKSPLGLMFQLGIFETWYKWDYINESSERMLQVTADDVRRVVKKYFDPKARTVIVYLTKGGAAAPAEDPELEKLLEPLPEEHRAAVKSMIKGLRTSTNTAELSGMAQRLELALDSGRMAEEQRTISEYMLKVIKKRIAELETAGKESD